MKVMKRVKRESNDVRFTKVALSWGFLGNMAAYPIIFNAKSWKTVEAAFQASRFPDRLDIQEMIREEKSPMGAKMKAKKFKKFMSVVPMSAEDQGNLFECVKIKFETHADIARKLKNTIKNNCRIIEDSSSRKGSRHQFWGSRLIHDDGVNYWEGDNVMGEILMRVRNEI